MPRERSAYQQLYLENRQGGAARSRRSRRVSRNHPADGLHLPARCRAPAHAAGGTRQDAALAGESEAERDKALRLVAGKPYYNTSQLTLTDLGTRARPERLAADLNAYLDGFSSNIRAILDQFGFRDRVQHLIEAGVLGTLIRKFTSAGIHLGPDPVRHADGTIMQPGLDDHGMRSVFENWRAAATRKPARRPASTGPPATRSGSWQSWSSCRSPGTSSRALIPV